MPGMTLKQIAAHLGISFQAVQQIEQRALRKMREEWERLERKEHAMAEIYRLEDNGIGFHDPDDVDIWVRFDLYENTSQVVIDRGRECALDRKNIRRLIAWLREAEERMEQAKPQ